MDAEGDRHVICAIGIRCADGAAKGKARSACSVILLMLGMLLGSLNFTSDNASAVPWSFEVIDYAGNVGEYSSLAIDGQNNLHVAYYDYDNETLKYAKWDGSYWNITVVDSAGPVDNHPSLALDSRGYPHIAYQNRTNWDLKYASWDGTKWVLEIVDSAYIAGYASSLVLDREDHPHISYWVKSGPFGDGPIRHAYWNGTQWGFEDLKSIVSNIGLATSIALDSGDNPHIAFFGWYDGYLTIEYASRVSGTWEYNNITTIGDMGYDLALAIDSSDIPHLVYGYGWDYGTFPEGMRHSKWTGSGWDTDVLEYDPGMVWRLGASVSITFDAADNPHVSYSGVSALKYARWNASAWEIEGVDSMFSWHAGTSTAIDGNGCVHITYARWGPDHDLVHASKCFSNAPPSKPSKPSGPDMGLVNNQYSFTTNSTDPENSKLRYTFDWGDGKTSVSGYNDSGVPVTLSHSWSATGTFWVKARAVDDYGLQSLWSDVAIIAMISEPSPPRNLNAASAGADQILLSWSPPLSDGNSPITNYTVYRGMTPGIETPLITIENITAYADTGLLSGQTYCYQVAARNLAGEGTRSNEACAAPATIPGPPTGLTATAGNGQVTLAWLAPTDDGGSRVTNYIIYRGLASGGETMLAEIGNFTTYVDMGLINGQIYYYVVGARNAIGMGPLSSEVNATPVGLPGPPRDLAVIDNINKVALAWSPPLDDGGFPFMNYTLYRGINGPAVTSYVKLGNVLTYTDTDVPLPVANKYSYRVSANNSLGEGPLSNETTTFVFHPPSPPFNPEAIAGDRQVTLRWSEPIEINGVPVLNYSVYRGTVSHGETFLTNVSWTGGIETFTDTGLTNGQTYYYYVTLWNIAGEGAASIEVDATPMTLPDAPLGLTANAGDTFVVLDWIAPASDGGSAITNYSVYRGLSPIGKTFLIELGNVLTFTDTGLVNGQAYYYEVAAKNAVGEGQRSNEASATPAATPGQPAGLMAVSGPGQVILTWSAPTDTGGFPIANYRVYRSIVSGAETFLIEIANVLTYTDSGLTNGQTYYYEVSAKNAIGEGARSAEAYATPATVPGAPAGLIAVAGDRQITLSWSAPLDNGGSPVSNYTIYRGTTVGGESFLTKLGSVLMYTDGGLTNGQAYYYLVTASNSIGRGPNSTEASAIPIAAPSAPLNLVLSVGNGTIVLNWNAPASDGGSPIAKYGIYRGIAAASETLLIEVGNVLTYTDTGLDNGQTYYYQVTAKNSNGEGPRSIEACATPVAVPGPPTGLMAVAGNEQVTLTWSAPTDDGGSPITKYTIYRGSTSGEETLLIELGNVLTFTDTGLANGQTYYYKVSASNSVGEGPKASEASATPSTSTQSGERSIFEEPWFWVAIVVGIIILLAVTIFIWRKKKEREKAGESPEQEKNSGE